MEKNNWVVRYYNKETPKSVHTFSKFKDSGDPSYAYKYDNIRKFSKVSQAFSVAKQLSETGKYVAVVNRIHRGKEDSYYFSGINL